MCTPSTPTDERYKCVECEKTFTRNYSLARHIVRAHTNIELRNEDTTAQQNQHNHNDTDTQTKHKCDLCKKCFSHNWCLTRHKSTCKGEKSPLECKNCLKTFKHARSLLRHSKKTCETKIKEVPLATAPINIGTQNNINTQNNTNIQNQNNNTNNILIVYNSTGVTPFTSDHLTAEDFKKILALATPNINNRAMAEYSKQILSHPDNRCVKKTDLKSDHSKVHTCDDTWEEKLDCEVYPRLANDMAANMFEFINAKRSQLKKDVFDKLRNFVDYMADNGYINTGDKEREREIKNEYNKFVKGLRLAVYGNRKKP